MLVTGRYEDAKEKSQIAYCNDLYHLDQVSPVIAALEPI